MNIKSFFNHLFHSHMREGWGRIVMLLAVSLLCATKASAYTAQKVAYACYTSNNSTVTFYYDNLYDERTGQNYTVIDPTYRAAQTPLWVTGEGANAVNAFAGATRVVFNSSFADAVVKFNDATTDEPIPSTAYWFCNMPNLTTITGLQYFPLNTQVEMRYMFYGCSSLTSIDLSCWPSNRIKNEFYMFAYCTELTTVYVGSDNFFEGLYLQESYMFKGCTKLVGGNGTVYDDSHPGMNYTHIDGGSANPGYLSTKDYVAYSASTKTLTFYHDDLMPSRNATMKYPFRMTSSGTAWMEVNADLRKVVFDSSFNSMRPTTMRKWFQDCPKLTTFENLQYLHTDEVTDMSYMFANCTSLKTFDLSHFLTTKVTAMTEMFSGCSSLTHLDGNFLDVRQVQSMSNMFRDCSSLTHLDLSWWVPTNLTSATSMFQGCSKLGVIIVDTDWTVSNVTESSQMFALCNNLVGGAGTRYNSNMVSSYNKNYARIDGGSSAPGFLTSRSQPVAYAYLENTSTSGTTKTLNFRYDSSFKSREGAFVLSSSTDEPGWADYKAQIDRVIITSSFADARPVSTYRWFAGMYNLTSIVGIENLNTEQVVHMNGMFDTCSKLTSLNLGGFNTQNVVNMSRMFCDCNNLEEILASNTWNTSNVGVSERMFSGCTKLVGGNGTPYNSSYTDKTYARLDAAGSPGYLTFVSEYQPYVTYNSSTHALTFYCDGQRESRASASNVTVYTSIDNPNLARWEGIASNVTSVTFDPSFATARPSNTSRWFDGMNQITSISGMQYLNTTRVTSMSSMFFGCSNLQNIDLSHFNTSCVTNMNTMFLGCSSLTELDLSHFNTGNVTNMGYMFNECSGLTVLDLSSFNTGKVTLMSHMFEDCSNLKTIYVGSGWNVSNVTSSYDMFTGCTKLVGGMGTTYNSNNVTDYYAYPDGGSSSPGYMTDVSKLCYAIYTTDNGGTLTLYCDGLIDSRTGTKYINIFNTGEDSPMWHEHRSDIKHVVIDPSFANARPSSIAWWFSLYSLEDIQGLENLNTSETTNMTSVFNGSKLTTLDLSHMDTHAGTTMANMFYNCTSLTTLNLGGDFDTGNVTDMHNMFGFCTQLTTINVGMNWTTAGVTNSSGMFTSCNRLVGSAGTAFSGSHVDKAYAHPDGGTANPGYLWYLEAYACFTASNNTLTFYYDYQREVHNATGTTYDIGNTVGWTAQAANIQHVVFDASFANLRPTRTGSWFQSMTQLKDITGMENLNTSEVTAMNSMFFNCGMTTLDLRTLDTRKVKNMSYMFCNSTALTTIYVGSNWNTDAVTFSDNMFFLSTNLVGGSGTTYNADFIDKTYARIDGENGNPGYLSRMTESYAEYTESNHKLTFYRDAQRDMHTGVTYDLNAAGVEPGWNAVASQVTAVAFDESFADARPTTTYKWFRNMSQLQTITGWEYFNTSYVTDMGSMFYGCSSLTALELKTFITQKAVSMNYMFYNCSSLTAIYVGTGWNTNAVVTSTSMFAGCTSLEGGAGTTYDSNKIDKAYACVDGIGGKQGYLSYHAYAYIADNDSRTLRFYYDTQREQREESGTTFDLNTGNTIPAWYDYREQFTQAIFDPSFANARPKSTYMWFSGMTNLHTLTGVSMASSTNYLNTSKVTNMAKMFYGCSSLWYLYLTNFDTGNVISMMDMFANSSKLHTILMSNFNTEKVTVMQSMFEGCSNLTTLDLSSFNTSQVRQMSWMFRNCTKLTTIFVSSSWSTSAVTTGQQVFTNCTSLVGGAGSAYSSGQTSYTYARIDGGSGSPGYLTALSSLPYALYTASDSTLTFYNDGRRDQRASEGSVFSLNIDYSTNYVSEWYDIRESIVHAVFDQSFASAHLTSTHRLFYALNQLVDIEGIEYLNTSEVTAMNEMFNGCNNLTSIDVSGFDTHNVTDMSLMFDNCRNLTDLDLSSFDTRNVTNMGGMFMYCSGLTELDLSSFNTANVTSMSQMFLYASSLKTIYVSAGWNTNAVTKSSDMFWYCNSIVGENGTRYNSSHCNASYACVDGDPYPGYLSMRREPYAVFTPDNDGTLTFYNDSQRNAREGTAFDVYLEPYMPDWASISSYVTHVEFTPQFAKIWPKSTMCWFKQMSNLTDITGIEYLNTGEVTNMNQMFAGCTKLTGIDLSSFDTGGVTDMHGMFNNCSSLTTLDLSTFDTENVTNMMEMFKSCAKLKTIYVKGGWNTENVTNSGLMFTGCNSLVGGEGTVYTESHVDKEYARNDDLAAGKPGYLTSIKEMYAFVPDKDNSTLMFYYDDQRLIREGVTYDMNVGWWDATPEWYWYNQLDNRITKVVFDPTFAQARPTTLAYWFTDFTDLTDISGWEYLCTDSVAYTDYMFSNCTGLTVLDLSNFNMQNVERTEGMFSGCTNLTTIYGGNWESDMLDYDGNMFYGCENLVGGAGTEYNSDNVYFNYAHIDGGVDNPGYFTLLVKEPYAVLDGNTLTFYYDGQKNTRPGTKYDIPWSTRPGWFGKGNITTVDFDPSFANYHELTSASKMFSSLMSLGTINNLDRLDTKNVTDMSEMFRDSYGGELTTLDLSCLNTENVTDMSNMFQGMGYLKTIDLTGFNTSKVTDMTNMFNYCSALTTIYVGNKWSTTKVTSSSRMFNNCSLLVGGNGTRFADVGVTDATYARVDVPGVPGYLTANFAFLRGDVNQDGLVTIADVTALVNIILGKTTVYNEAVADVNGDNNITIADVTALVNIILGK